MKKEIRTTMLYHLCDYIETKGVDKEELLAGLPVDFDFLKLEGHWVDKDTMDQLMTRASELVPEPDFFFQVGVFSVLDETKGLKGKILQLTENPQMVYYEVAILGFLFNKVYKIDVMHADKHSAEIKVKAEPPHLISYDNCQYIRGLLAAVPEIFHLGLASIKEPQCAVTEISLKPELINPQTNYGSSQCHYFLTW